MWVTTLWQVKLVDWHWICVSCGELPESFELLSVALTLMLQLSVWHSGVKLIDCLVSIYVVAHCKVRSSCRTQQEHCQKELKSHRAFCATEPWKLRRLYWKQVIWTSTCMAPRSSAWRRNTPQNVQLFFKPTWAKASFMIRFVLLFWGISFGYFFKIFFKDIFGGFLFSLKMCSCSSN